MKRTPPRIPVITPTGNSMGRATVLATVSQRIRKIAPERKELIITILWSTPTHMRTKWGTTRPTNPIAPERDTQTPVSRDCNNKNYPFRPLNVDTEMERLLLAQGHGVKVEAEEIGGHQPREGGAKRKLDKNPIRFSERTYDPEKDVVEVLGPGDRHNKDDEGRRNKVYHDPSEEKTRGLEGAAPDACRVEKKDHKKAPEEPRYGKGVNAENVAEGQDDGHADSGGGSARYA